jgi:hypothetical protein
MVNGKGVWESQKGRMKHHGKRPQEPLGKRVEGRDRMEPCRTSWNIRDYHIRKEAEEVWEPWKLVESHGRT